MSNSLKRFGYEVHMDTSGINKIELSPIEVRYCEDDAKNTILLMKHMQLMSHWYGRLYCRIKRVFKKLKIFLGKIFKKQSKKYRDISNVDEIHEHCNSTNTIVSDGEKVIYLCDKKACDMCPETECKHTFDITHAVNFECFDGIHYFEKEK